MIEIVLRRIEGSGSVSETIVYRNCGGERISVCGVKE